MPAVEFRDPTETTAPVADTTAGLWTFSPPATDLQIDNRSGQVIYVRVNSASAASATAYDFTAYNGQRLGGFHFRSDMTVQTVSIWFPAAATVTSIAIRGI